MKIWFLTNLRYSRRNARSAPLASSRTHLDQIYAQIVLQPYSLCREVCLWQSVIHATQAFLQQIQETVLHAPWENSRTQVAHKNVSAVPPIRTLAPRASPATAACVTLASLDLTATYVPLANFQKGLVKIHVCHAALAHTHSLQEREV